MPVAVHSMLRRSALAVVAAAALAAPSIANAAATTGARDRAASAPPTAQPSVAAAAGSITRAGKTAAASVLRAIETTTPSRGIRPHQLLVRVRGDKLQRIVLAPGLDPVAVARRLRARPDLFTSAAPNVIATAAGFRDETPEPDLSAFADPTARASSASPASAAQATTPIATTPAATTPSPTTPVVPPKTVPDGGADPTGIKGWVPNDHVGTIPWTSLQWNFVGQYGVGAPQAWDQLRTRGGGRAGGRGVTVAVIDSGLAYRTQGMYVRSPDLPADRVLRGYDFVGRDRFPDDRSGHGTHVASTIAGATDNDAGLTGLAYKAKLLPIRVLDAKDRGDVYDIARGIRYAIQRKADIINLSVDFPIGQPAAEIPEILSALSAARRAGILVVSSAGNDGGDRIALPARSSLVVAVGATTARGCRSSFSNSGPQLDLVAPGGGRDHFSERDGGRCRPGQPGPPIAQVTLLRARQPGVLGVPTSYVGTSMAAAHVTAIAALVRGSGILGADPSPELLQAFLERSTTDLGVAGKDTRYGAGLLNARSATNYATGRVAARSARAAVARAAVARAAR